MARTEHRASAASVLRAAPMVGPRSRRRPMTTATLGSVSEHSRQEVARRAGVDPGYVDRLVELGILRPGAGGAFSQGDARRARWVHGLERSGVPPDRMAAAVRDGALSFSFRDPSAFDRF